MAEAVDPREPGAPPPDEPDLLPARPDEPSTALEPARRGGALGPPLPPSKHAPRFRMLTGALVGVAIGALAAAAVLVAGGGPKIGPAWSLWKPSAGDAKSGADQIARHVAPNYRLPSGDQLVLVTGGPLKVADLNLPVRIAVDNGGGTADAIKLVNGKTAMYVLCGLGPRCAIARGKPSTERFLLLRREALELALYSFRYLNVSNVVALLPPAPGKKPTNAMFFRRNDLQPALSRPLDSTLPSPPPTLNALPTSPEATLITKLTNRNLFSYSFQQGQDLGAFLVLARLSNG
jgi:hypothetical protein